jgi:hypothetical protein
MDLDSLTGYMDTVHEMYTNFTSDEEPSETLYGLPVYEEEAPDDIFAELDD